MTIPCVIRPQADLDIDAITDYLVGQAGIEIGWKFLSELDETLKRLSRNPMIGWRCKLRHPRLAGTQIFRVSARFREILVFYVYDRKRIEVIRVLHGARDLENLFDRGS